MREHRGAHGRQCVREIHARGGRRQGPRGPQQQPMVSFQLGETQNHRVSLARSD